MDGLGLELSLALLPKPDFSRMVIHADAARCLRQVRSDSQTCFPKSMSSDILLGGLCLMLQYD